MKRLGSWLSPVLAVAGFAGLLAAFAWEMSAFRGAVEDWARRDLEARAELAAAHLREPLATGDFRQLGEFARTASVKGIRFTAFSAPGGVLFDSLARDALGADWVYAERQSGANRIRLGVPRATVLAPFRRARWAFLLAALAGGAGVLLASFHLIRQRIRIRELSRLEAFRRTFIADLSHEIKTPITGIRGAAELLAADCVALDADARRQLFDRVVAETGRLDALARDVLALARLERGDEAIVREPVDLVPSVGRALAALRERARAKGVRVEAELPAACVARCDEALVVRALENLVGNAIRHSGSPVVRVTLESSRGGGARITVEDRGRGIAPELRSRVFERFFRVDAARAADDGDGGAGLGLAIVRRIARLHGGECACTGAEPSGCRFVFAF